MPSGAVEGRELLRHVIGDVPVTVTVAGTALPRVGPVSIRHGRDDTTAQPDAATCTVTLEADILPTLPQVGDPVTVDLTAAATGWAGLTGPDATAATRRFTGHVTDVQATPPRASNPALVTVLAVSPRSRLGRTFVGDTPWPDETDGARAGRILAVAAPQIGATVGDVDPGTVTVLARDVDRQPALDLLAALALDSRAVLVETRAGTLEWHDANHRGRAMVDVELAADNLLASMAARQGMTGLVNALTVTYGPTVEGSERPSTGYTDPASLSLFGPFGATLSSQLLNEADALEVARATVGRRSRPRWLLDALTVDLLRTVTPSTAGQLLRLEQADLVRLTGLPEVGPFVSARRWVEGWTETLTRTSWRMSLSTSDYGLTAPAPRWLDVPTFQSWADTRPLAWLQAEGWDPGEQYLARWVDQPLDLEWAEIDPALTWQTA